MKKIVHLIFLLLICSLTFAQTPDPAKWTYTVEQGKAGEATLIFKIKMDPDWHIYSQFTSDGGPLAMEYTFDSSPCYERVGKVTEPKPEESFDSLFGVKVMYFNKEVTMRQTIKVKKDACKVTGKVSYQVCKDACIALEKNFSFTIGKTKSEIPGRGGDSRADASGLPSQNSLDDSTAPDAEIISPKK
jgi:DsbC/DsbD-like thiol-disulfide interchange protein